MKTNSSAKIIGLITGLAILGIGFSHTLVFGQGAAAPPAAGPAAAGAPAAPAGAARGGAAAGGIPNVTTNQTSAINAMESSLTNQTAAVTAARLAVVSATFAEPRNEADLRNRIENLRAAELALANARADQFVKIQASADRFSAEQTQALALQTFRGGPARAGGARGGASTNPGGVGADAAAAQAQKLVTADKVVATLFASEPMVVNPADMDIDSRGRVWVTEGANYRQMGLLRPGGDRILILEDTNQDGRADKSTLFYQDMTVNTALGICVLGNKAIVSSSPYVFVLTDSNDDGVADKRELLFEDNSNGNHDHCLHAFTFGPDGKLYFNFGNQVRELRRPKGGLMTLPLNGPVPAHEFETVVDLDGNPVIGDGKVYRQGMAFRCNLDGTEVETLGWNFRNPYELAVDSFGSLWQSDNDDDGNQGVRILQVMYYGNYGFQDEITGAAWGQQTGARGSPFPARLQFHWHQSDPGVAPLLLGTGAGSPTGITVYEGKLLPESVQNQAIHADGRPGVARAYAATKSGAGYTASIVNILTPLADDTWYRPSDVSVAPDGSLYVSDWNDGTVGGHSMQDRGALETMTGRIYRMAPAGNKSSVPRLDLTTAAGAVAGLQSPNLATRYLAWTALHDMKAGAESELVKLATKPATGLQPNGRPAPADEPRMRARALFVLAQIPGSGQKYVEQALRDTDEDIRIVGLRLAHELKLDLIPYVRQVAKDSSAQVRREAILSLRHSASPEMADLWVTLAQQYDGQDRWYLEALGIGADRQWEKLLPAWLAKVGDNIYTPAAREIIWRSRSNTTTPDLLVKLIQNKETNEAQKARYMRSFDFVSGPAKEAALLKMLAPPATN